ncbi:MAG: biopolymer transporter ExbD [Gammaproteobacteria bacterium]|nr:MAG: biopolymer transporter ExbD [Gammaproteobacteria bacterium]
MRFANQDLEELDLNLTSLIDVVFLLLIFFMVTTTFQQQSKIQINLPQAESNNSKQYKNKIQIAINKNGFVFIDNIRIDINNDNLLKKSLSKYNKNSIIIIKADAIAPHQAVISVMDAAAKAGINSISFATTKLE